MAVEYFTGFEHGGAVSGTPYDISTGDGWAESLLGGTVEIVPSGTFAGPHVHSEHSLHVDVTDRQKAFYTIWKPNQYGLVDSGSAQEFDANPLYLSLYGN